MNKPDEKHVIPLDSDAELEVLAFGERFEWRLRSRGTFASRADALFRAGEWLGKHSRKDGEK